MPELLALQDATEAELLERAREGDSLSVSELYRRHRPAAEAYAAGLTHPQRAADITADAMVKVFGLMERGLGPERAFRAYLFSTVRTLAIDNARKTSRETPVEDFNGYDEFVAEDLNATKVEHADIIDAFKTLPPRSQQALWEHLVEGRPLDEVGENLDLTANAVAALSFRAREALRQAYLAQHLACTKNPDCDLYTDHLPKHVRGKLKGRTRRDVEAHLDVCHACSTTTVALISINDRLGALLLPAILAGGLAVTLDAEAANAATQKFADSAGGASTAVARTARRTAMWVAGASVAVIAAAGVTLLVTSGDEQPTDAIPHQAPPSDLPLSSQRTELAPSQNQSVVDPAVSEGTTSTLGHVASNWQHVTFPVTADEHTTIALRVEGAKTVIVHTDLEHGDWDCTTAPGASTTLRALTCVVPADQMTSTAIALDVEPGAGQVKVKVSIAMKASEDTDLTNNRASVELRS